MAKRITTVELNKGLKEAKEEAQGLLLAFDGALKNIQDLAAILKANKGGLNLADAKDIEKLNNVFNESNQLVKQRQKADSESAKLKKQLNALSDEEVKGKIRFQKAAREQKKLLEAQIVLEKKQIKSLNDLVEQNKALKTVRDSLDTEKEAKEIKRLSDQIDDNTRTLDENKKAKRDQKALDEAILTLADRQIKSLKDLRAQNKALKIARDSLDIEADADEIKRFNDQIDANTEKLEGNSDAQAQLKFRIGNYREEVSAAIKDNVNFGESFGAIGALIQGLATKVGNLRQEQKEQEDQTDQNAKGLRKFGNAAKVAGKALIASGIGALVLVLGTLLNQFRSTREGAKLFQQETAKALTAVKVVGGFAIDFIRNKFNQLEANMKIFSFNITKAQKELQILFATITRSDTGQLEKEVTAINKLIEAQGIAATTADENLLKLEKRSLSDELASAQEASSKLVDNQFALGDATAVANIEIAKQKALEEALLTIADDDTRGFNERNEAKQKLLKIQASENSAGALAVKLAEEQLKLQRDTVALQLQESAVDPAIVASLKDQSSLTRALIADQESLKKIAPDALTALSDAEVALIDARGERAQQLLDNNEKLRKLLFDEVEQTVDFLIDGNEQIKVSNEKLINDEKKNLATRRALLLETQELIRESNIKVQNEIAKTVDGVTGKDIASAFDEALSVEDLNERLKALGNAEIPITRLLELFKETKAQARDFEDLNKTLDEADAKAAEVSADIEAQRKVLSKGRFESEEDLNKSIEALERERLDNKIDLLEREISALEDNSTAQLEKQQELNDLLIEDQKKHFADKQELEKKDAEETKKKREETEEFLRDLGDQTAEAFFNAQIQKSQAREKEIADDIAQARSRNSELLSLSASADSVTSQNAADSLARQREIEREKTQELEREKKKQIRLEFILAGLKAFSNNAGKPNATGKTVADLGVLIAGLGAVKINAFDGLDRINERGEGIDNKGGMLAINHPNEMIVEEKLNKKMGFPSRYDVADVFTRYKDGELIDRNGASQQLQQVIVQGADNSALISKMDEMIKEYKNTSQIKAIVDTQKGLMKLKERKGNRINVYID